MYPSHDIGRDGLVHIIVVDDEPTLRLGFKYTLTSETTVVHTAEDGRMGLEMAAERPYDLMILDLRMPDMDGIEVLKALRERGNPIPIILCSAGFTARAALEAIRNGVVDFLLKPLRPVEIRNAVETLLNPKEENGQGATETALKAVRSGRPGEAIRILRDCHEPGPLGMHWLSILQAINDTEPGTDSSLVAEIIDATLPLLAMNAPPTR